MDGSCLNRSRIFDEIIFNNFSNIFKSEFELCEEKTNARIFQRFLILKNPNQVVCSELELLSKFYQKFIPHFLTFLVLENIILWFQRKPTYRLNDSLTSVSNGVIQHCGKLIFRGTEMYLYVIIYTHFHVLDLPWDYRLTWYLAAVGVDFGYYWLHRASHEVHILWAQHQVHHSSEEFNLAVGLRQSIAASMCGVIFYLPLALVIPPEQFIVHQEFNLMFQVFVHTKAISTLGPLEFIFNTPNHHRVHHGSNLYCLDKNYGGVLIIWDRIFGTFGKEDQNEAIIYGLVFNQPSFNPLHLQTFYTRYVFQGFKSMNTWKNKLAAVFYGPSWKLGRPRLGVEEDKIKVLPREKYDVQLPAWCNFYLSVHFLLVIYGYQELAARHMGMNPISVIGFVCYIIASLTTIGMLFDNKQNAYIFEVLRCIVFVITLQFLTLPGINAAITLGITIFFSLSGVFWFMRAKNLIEIR